MYYFERRWIVGNDSPEVLVIAINDPDVSLDAITKWLNALSAEGWRLIAVA